MRILLVNPNTTASMTEKAAVAARAVAAAGTEIITATSRMGPVSIEGHYDGAMALPGLLAELKDRQAEGYDAAIIACFDDTGLEAARSFYRFPARNDVPADSLPEALRRAREEMRAEPMRWDLLREKGAEWMRYWDEHIRGRG